MITLMEGTTHSSIANAYGKGTSCSHEYKLRKVAQVLQTHVAWDPVALTNSWVLGLGNGEFTREGGAELNIHVREGNVEFTRENLQFTRENT